VRAGARSFWFCRVPGVLAPLTFERRQVEGRHRFIFTDVLHWLQVIGEVPRLSYEKRNARIFLRFLLLS
jgi:hypothetical protein